MCLTVILRPFANDEFSVGTKITEILESNWGMKTLHPGLFPEYWIHSGGMLGMGYLSCIEGMIISLEILCQEKLNQFKLCSERKLFTILVNTNNHCKFRK